MKQLLSLVLLLATITTLFSQTISLRTTCPEPRVGQSFTITINIDFFNDYLKENLPAQLVPAGYSNWEHSWDMMAIEPGTFTVGPLEIVFNGRTYITDILHINVLPELPRYEGLWIRLMSNRDEQFIVLEQLMESLPMVRKKAAYGDAFAPIEQPPFVTLVPEPLSGLEFFRRQSQTNYLQSDAGTSLAYSIQIYKITNRRNTPQLLSKEFFVNWPKKQKLPELPIPRTE